MNVNKTYPQWCSRSGLEHVLFPCISIAPSQIGCSFVSFADLRADHIVQVGYYLSLTMMVPFLCSLALLLEISGPSYEKVTVAESCGIECPNRLGLSSIHGISK